MDVSTQVKWWNCDGRIGVGKRWHYGGRIAKGKMWHCDERIGEGKMVALWWTYRRR
jgi:hypothetical protein